MHICDDVRLYGPLDSYSCFPFENCLGKLKRMVKGKYIPLRQIHNRLKEAEDCSNKFNFSKQNKEFIASGIINKRDGYFECKQLIFRGILFSTNKKNCTVSKRNGVIYIIKKIINIDNQYKCIAAPFKYLNNFFTYPINSSVLGIFFGSGQKKLVMFNFNEVHCKYLRVPYKEGFVLTPILHTIK